MAYEIFVSYAQPDAELAQQIFQRAYEAGIKAYLYQHHQSPGVTIGPNVLKQINNADAVVVLFTKAGARSAYVNQEIGAALAFEKRVIAIVEQSVAPGRLGMLNGVEHVPLVANSDAVLHKVVVALQKAKEKKSNLLWSIGSILVTLFVTSQVKKKVVEHEDEADVSDDTEA